MAKAFFKRWTARLESIKTLPALSRFAHHLQDPNLFHLNRRSVSMAFFWGMLIALLPIPGQMPIAALVAVVARTNLLITVALAWVSNPITTPLFLFCIFHIGAFVLQSDYVFLSPEFTVEWFTHSLLGVWKPLVVGSILGSLSVAILSYTCVRFLWRLHVVIEWNRRKQARASR